MMNEEDKSKTPQEIVAEELLRRRDKKVRDGLYPDVADMMIEVEHGKQAGKIIKKKKEKENE